LLPLLLLLLVVAHLSHCCLVAHLRILRPVPRLQRALAHCLINGSAAPAAAAAAAVVSKYCMKPTCGCSVPLLTASSMAVLHLQQCVKQQNTQQQQQQQLKVVNIFAP
jgi:hypothetical protein